MDDPTTHSPTCYREHHACAVARLDRLRDYLSRATLTVAPHGSVVAGIMRSLLVAVRDITEVR